MKKWNFAIHVRFVFAIVFMCFSNALLASLSQDHIDKQRKRLVKAESALKQGNLSTFHELEQSLTQHPLHGYLRFRYLDKYITQQQPETMSAFFDEYADSPISDKLRVVWLKHLVSLGKDSLFMEFYKPGLGNVLTCKSLDIQFRQGKSLEHLDPIIASVWMTGKSLPPECDRVITHWKTSQFLHFDRVWERLSLAMKRRNYPLARHLKHHLPQDKRYLVDWWIELRRYPQRIARKAQQPPRSSQETHIFTQALKSLAWKKRDEAISAWQDVQYRRTFSPQEISEIVEAIAVSLAVDNHPDASTWLTMLPQVVSSPKLNEWRLRHALRQKDWHQVYRWLNQLNFSETDIGADGHQYWYARTLLVQGWNDAAERVLTLLSEERGYYGFLASAHLGKDPNFGHQPLDSSPDLIAKVENYPTLQRAKELHALGRFVQARREWNGLYRQLSENELKAAARIAAQWGWFDRSIFTAAAVNHMDDIELRFPLAYEEPISRQSHKHNIDSSWAFAVARQESAFMADVRSRVGATGLMQIMPYTAKALAKRMRLRYRGKIELTRPEKNIRFGTYYLKELSDRYEGNQILATASYNAGPHRVVKWIPEDDTLAMDIWIENIPFNETRKYVKNVAAFQTIYGKKLDQPNSMIQQVINHTIGQVAVKPDDSSAPKLAANTITADSSSE